MCILLQEHSLFLRSTGTTEGERNVIKGKGMDIELIPTEDGSPLPVPTAHHLCVITTPTQQQLNAISFDFQLYFSLLKTATLGRTVLYTPIISSTQTVFTGNLPFADSLPASLGTVCVAGRQTNGIGRYIDVGVTVGDVCTMYVSLRSHWVLGVSRRLLDVLTATQVWC